jgi:hypothetical protein
LKEAVTETAADLIGVRMRLQTSIDRNFAKAEVGKNQSWFNEISSDGGNHRKLFKRGGNMAMTAMVRKSWPPIRIFFGCQFVSGIP